MEQHEKQLLQWYALENRIQSQLARQRELNEQIPQCRWEKREAEGKLLEYGGSLSALLDKLRGRQEDKKESLEREIRSIETTLNSLLREKEALEQRLAEARQEQETLPHPQELRCKGLDSLWAALETRRIVNRLIPLLNQTDKGLKAYRNKLRGGNLDRLAPIEEHYQLETVHIAPAEQCLTLLEELQPVLKIRSLELEIPGYFRAPAGFIEGAAAKHNRIDRINLVMDQVRETTDRIITILTLLDD